MSIPGTGAQNDPYIVGTYADLVEKAAESGKYINIGADIDVKSEYPNGDAPSLVVSSFIDGTNHKIANFYKTTGGETYCVSVGSGGSITNTIFTNIDVEKVFLYTASTPITNCKFSGKSTSMFLYGNELNKVSRCSFNLDLGSALFAHFYDAAALTNCHINVNSTATDLFEYGRGGYSDITLINCYVEGNMPNYSGFTSGRNKNLHNCAFDVNSTATFTLGSSTGAVSIVNKTHAPNVTGSGQVKEVLDANWLDISYLQSIGFMAVEEAE